MRPDFNLSDVTERKRAMQFLHYQDCKRMWRYFCCWVSSEGRVKGLISTPEFTAREHELYRKIKQTFDPNSFLNPETKLGASFADVVRHLLYHRDPRR